MEGSSLEALIFRWGQIWRRRNTPCHFDKGIHFRVVWVGVLESAHATEPVKAIFVVNGTPHFVSVCAVIPRVLLWVLQEIDKLCTAAVQRQLALTKVFV